MSFKKSWLAVPAVLALTLTACSGGAGSADQSGASAAPAGDVVAGDPIRTNGSEPQHPLLPGLTTETGGGKVLDATGAGLVYYDAKGETHNELAESIESSDNITWTIKVKEGKKFSDGSDIKAKNFVDAWVLVGAENQDNAFFFEPVKGYDDKGEKHDLAQGIKLVDDYTFTVELKQAEADFPARLGYSVFQPLADAALADMDAQGENPIASGPYMLAENGWEHNVQIKLVPNPHYDGDRVAKNAGLNIVIYNDMDAAYNDLQGGNLDVLDAIPSSAFDTFQSEFEGRSVIQGAAVFQSFAIPQKGHFAGEEGKLRRQAISMAINRDELVKALFNDTRKPAKDFTSPVVAGYNDAIPGNEVLTFNPEKAKELWAQADAMTPFSGKFEIAYNGDGGHKDWVDAVTNMLRNNLGIEAEGKSFPDFKSFRNEITERRIETAFRTGWQGDYPSKFNFLGPLYGTTGSSNDTGYSNPKFDELLTKAAGSASLDEANKILDEAQQILFQDMPVIPTWYGGASAAWSDSVDNVEINWKSVPEYHNITRK